MYVNSTDLPYHITQSNTRRLRARVSTYDYTVFKLDTQLRTLKCQSYRCRTTCLCRSRGSWTWTCLCRSGNSRAWSLRSRSSYWRCRRWWSGNVHCDRLSTVFANWTSYSCKSTLRSTNLKCLSGLDVVRKSHIELLHRTIRGLWCLLSIDGQISHRTVQIVL